MKKILLVGLGNPGDKFTQTRHNLGIKLLKAWLDKVKTQATQFKDWREDSKCFAESASVVINDKKIDCIFPLTFMNDSGKSVASYMQKEGIDIGNILILHDDLELSFGEVKFKAQGGAAGHKGVRSIHEHLGTKDIARLRLGIGRPPENLEVDKFVLQKFTAEEVSHLELMSEKVNDFLDEFIGR